MLGAVVCTPFRLWRTIAILAVPRVHRHPDVSLDSTVWDCFPGGYAAMVQRRHKPSSTGALVAHSCASRIGQSSFPLGDPGTHGLRGGRGGTHSLCDSAKAISFTALDLFSGPGEAARALWVSGRAKQCR